MESIRDSVDCNLYFFGTKVETGTMYLILCASTLLLIGIYVAFNVVAGRRRK